ncbi:UMF1 family MFS transporter [Nocardioides ginsengisegetis]|uniref:UMF1 family MFS transporter n=1 Tax=Nocardioides ginsengisegetis TaxID=661491 RepID=A0A7W3IZ56_9ACTN|nr:MFS transporter [Nocardioides ginsengisegetis]MBA8803380.1 UMF1 family MFS transporter [Nocardioides ginsengisegetis]
MTATPGFADLTPLARAREQKAWYWYDWANSAYVTTIGTVLFAPYLISVAERAACGFVTDEDKGLMCTDNLHVLGLGISPGSLVFYVVTIATIVSALILPVVGAAADRSAKKKSIMAGFAWAGSLAAALMFFVTGTDWQLGVLLLFVANICLGSSLVVYDAILCEIALPDERDRVSSRGWALGYLGGGLLLAVNLAVVTLHDSLGLGTGMAVRLSMLSAAAWWAIFTIIPYRGIHNREPLAVEREPGGLVRQSFGQLWATLKDMRNYPMTLTFLLAYLFYNDGIQTVIVSASTYGDKQLGFDTSVLIATILLVQFVAFFGALLFGRLAATRGSRQVILGGLAMWMVVVVVAYFMPEKNVVLFLALAVGIGLVLGGTQALSRSFFSQLIPRGREAEYFSLYQACERGTSWLGTLVFGVVHQLTHSYRPAIVALVVFFAVGMALLARVDPRRGIEEAGNTAPQVV